MKPKVDMEQKKELAKRLKEIRTDLQLSQADFAATIEVSRVHYNRMEAEDVEMMPSQATLARLCAYHNVLKDWLMTGKGDKYADQKTVSFTPFHEINQSTINNTLEFVNLKAKAVLEREYTRGEQYYYYFQFFNALMETSFSMLQELQTYNENRDMIRPDFFKEYQQIYDHLLQKENKRNPFIRKEE